MTERERLVEELKTRFHNLILYPSTIDRVADFILEDRRRICEPLLEWNNWDKKGCFGNDYNNHLEGAKKANRQTLKLAGLEDGL